MTRLHLAARMFALAALALAPASHARAGDEEFEPDRVVVRLHPGASIADLNAQYGTATVDSVPGRDVYLLDVRNDESEPSFAEKLAKDPRVIWADVNYITSDPGPGTQSFYLASSLSEFNKQYARPLINLPDAHTLALGVGVRVAVLDSGIDVNHPLFAGAILTGGYNFIDNSTDLADVPTGIDSDNDGLIDEMVGHGTFVSGLIRLAAPGAGLLPIKVLDSNGWTTTFRVAEGIDFAILSGAHVINLSLGSRGEDTVWNESISWASDAGVLVVAAAGNEGNETPGWNPARVPDVLAVASTDAIDTRSPFSNYGKYVDLCAPGTDIVSSLPGGAYGLASGTSHAAPLVTGILALMKEIRPALSAADIRLVIAAATDPISKQNPGFDGLLGSGRLNADQALRFLCPADFNADRFVDTGDFFSFLDAFFSLDPAADFDRNGTINSQDFFEFFSTWLAGC